MIPWLASWQETGSTQSDAEHITKELESLGYLMMLRKVDAQAHGSRACRERIYFIGMKCGVSAHKLHYDDFDSVLNVMQLEPLPAKVFVNLENHPVPVATVSLEHREGPGQESQGGDKKVAVYKDDHLDLYAQVKLPWPPDITGASYQGLTRRAAEVLYFAHHVWPLEPCPDGTNEVEFLDVNNSLARLLGTKFVRGSGMQADLASLSPWKSMAMTITSHSIVCLRAQVGSQVVLRKAAAYEVMALAGWDWTWWQANQELESEALGISLAGNAFSAFAVGPVLTAALVGHSSILEARRSGVLKEAESDEGDVALQRGWASD